LRHLYPPGPSHRALTGFLSGLTLSDLLAIPGNVFGGQARGIETQPLGQLSAEPLVLLAASHYASSSSVRCAKCRPFTERRSCPHRLVQAASSCEPPTSVGLACRPVGACRRHLVKRMNYTGFNRYEALSGLNTPDTQQRTPKSRISSGISSPAMTGDNCDCGQLVGTGRQAMIPAHLVELLIDPLAAPDRHVAMIVGNE
jgi:hypothetical protein